MSELTALIQKLNKGFGEERICLGSYQEELPKIPFSSPRLNYMLYGGIPMYRITEFSRADSSGKSTTALDIIKNYQNMDNSKNVLYVDVEGTFDNYWATKLGVDVDKVIVFNPQVMSAENVFEISLNFVRTGEVGLFILDSVPALVPDLVFEEDYEKQEMGGISKSLTRFCRDLHPLLISKKCTAILLNQVRDNFNYGGGVTTPGGRALKHYCSVRMMFSKGLPFDEHGKELSRNAQNPAGHTVDVRLLKSKVCPNNRLNGCYSLNYLGGIDYITDTIDCAINLGLISASGPWYKLYDLETGELTDTKFQGKNAVVNYFKEDKEQFHKLYDKVLQELGKK